MNTRKRGKSIRHPASKESKLLKKKVGVFFIYLFIFIIVYTLFFSVFFRVQYIKIVGNDSVNTEEIENIIWKAIDKNILLVFKRHNYWLLSTNYLLDSVRQEYVFEDITIKKKFPNTVSLHVIEKMGRLVWKTGPDYYVLDAHGVITRRLHEMRLITSGDIPVIIDKSESSILIGDLVLSDTMIENILDSYAYYHEYLDRDGIRFDRFEIDTSTEVFYKLITRDGLEIHLNDKNSAVSQLSKFKRVVETENLDFSNLSYINLRVENQVIYK
jgi:cell division septal protein FtsQ